MPTREQVMSALVTRLSSSSFVTVSRRNRGVESLPQSATPALMVVGHKEAFDRAAVSLPAKIILHVLAIIYVDVGTDENAVPDSVLNPLLDTLSASLVPDSPQTGRCTLNGLVQSVMIDGEIEKAPGDITGKGLAVVPIQIIFMQTL